VKELDGVGESPRSVVFGGKGDRRLSRERSALDCCILWRELKLLKKENALVV
jgi:hypothetical protein